MEQQSNVNLYLFAYALGLCTMTELVKTLKDIGFSPVIVNILVARAERQRRLVEKDGSQCQDNIQAIED